MGKGLRALGLLLLLPKFSPGAPPLPAPEPADSPQALLATMKRSLDSLQANPNDRAAQRSLFDLAKKLSEMERLPADLAKERELAVQSAKAYFTAEEKQLQKLRKELGRLLEISSNFKAPMAILEASRQVQTLPPLVEDPTLEAYVNTIYRRLGSALNKGLFMDKRLLYEARGYLYFNDKDWEKAQKEWAKALKLDKDNPTLKGLMGKARKSALREQYELKRLSLMSKGKAYMNSGQYEKAVHVFQELVEAMPEDSEAQRLFQENQAKFSQQEKERQIAENLAFGMNFQGRHKYLEAAEHFLKVIQLDPSDTTANAQLRDIMKALTSATVPKTVLGSVLPAKGRPVQKDAADQADIYYQQGLLLYIQGNKIGAKENWRRAIKAYPLNEKAQAALDRLAAEEKFSLSP